MLTAIEVNFSQLMYSVDENSMNLAVTLIFSNPSSTDINVVVISTPHAITGEWTFDAKAIEFKFAVLS